MTQITFTFDPFQSHYTYEALFYALKEREAQVTVFDRDQLTAIGKNMPYLDKDVQGLFTQSDLIIHHKGSLLRDDALNYALIQSRHHQNEGMVEISQEPLQQYISLAELTIRDTLYHHFPTKTHGVFNEYDGKDITDKRNLTQIVREEMPDISLPFTFASDNFGFFGKSTELKKWLEEVFPDYDFFIKHRKKEAGRGVSYISSHEELDEFIDEHHEEEIKDYIFQERIKPATTCSSNIRSAVYQDRVFASMLYYNAFNDIILNAHGGSKGIPLMGPNQGQTGNEVEKDLLRDYGINPSNTQVPPEVERIVSSVGEYLHRKGMQLSAIEVVKGQAVRKDKQGKLIRPDHQYYLLDVNVFPHGLGVFKSCYGPEEYLKPKKLAQLSANIIAEQIISQTQ